MKNKIFAIALFAIAAAVTGCKKDVTKDIANFADKACACKDAACANGVLADFVAFAKDNKSATGDQGEAVESAKRMATCMISSGVDAQKLMSEMKSLTN
jgi:hypothetical protein